MFILGDRIHVEAMAELSLASQITLNNGVTIPNLGLGVFQVPNDAAHRIVLQALNIGYRHIDTAAYYQNEEGVGRAVRESGVPREEVFVTTKLWNSDHGFREALNACDRSLRALGLDYVDLYLIHWPRSDRRVETWRALERILDEGKARAIGVSNYLPRHLDETIANASVVPAIDQVEFSPFLYQKELLSYRPVQGHGAGSVQPAHQGKEAGGSPPPRLGQGLWAIPGPAIDPVGPAERNGGHSQVR